jgi:hypothetical protein
MPPQGFGFEARCSQRRSGEDRREERERRLEERRERVVPVLLERRIGPDRRTRGRRANHGPRRTIADRRNTSFGTSGGLRLTGDVEPPEDEF